MFGNNAATTLVVHTGGLGDLVLAARLIEGLKAGLGGPIVLLLRKPFLEVPKLFPHPPDQVLALDFDPHRQSFPTDDLRQQLHQLLETLRDLNINTVIVADLQPTWLSWFLIAVLSETKTAALSSSLFPRGLLPLLIKDFQGKKRDLEGPTLQPGLHENQRYNLLLQHLHCPPPDLKPWPKPALDPQLAASAGVTPGKYIACFPTGAASTLAKRWSPENYASVLAGRLNVESKLLLTGESSELGALQEFKQAFSKDREYIRLFTGSAQDIPKLASLLAHSKMYFGNDTGPAHLAQAYGVPGVVVFGGGTWPHYGPWGRGSVGVVQPLGCFGCGWDCAFGKAYCLEAIPVEKVREAFELAQSSPLAKATVLEATAGPQFDQNLLAATAAGYKLSQQERQQRFDAALELEGQFQFPIKHREWPQPVRAQEDTIDRLQAALSNQMTALQLVDKALKAFLPEAGITVSGYEDLEAGLLGKLARDRELAGMIRSSQTAFDDGVKVAAQRIDQLNLQMVEVAVAAKERLSLLEKVSAELEQSKAEVLLVTEGLEVARQQLHNSGEREKGHMARMEALLEGERTLLAEVVKLREETLRETLIRHWKSRS